MPDYVPIQDLTIVGSVSDNDLFPMSDGSGAYAVRGSTIKSYSATDAASAAADAALSKTAAQNAATAAGNAQTAAENAQSAVAGAAADAEASATAAEAAAESANAVGVDLRSLFENFAKGIDLIDHYKHGDVHSTSGINYEWSGSKLHVFGTNSNGSTHAYTFFSSTTSLPYGVTAGAYLYPHIDSSVSSFHMGIWWYDDQGTLNTLLNNDSYTGTVRVPSSAVGMIIRLQFTLASSGSVDFYVDPTLFTCPTMDYTVRHFGLLWGGDFNDIKHDSAYFTSTTFTYQNAPDSTDGTTSAGFLYTTGKYPGGFWVLQLFCSVRSAYYQKMWSRIYNGGTSTWGSWVEVGTGSGGQTINNYTYNTYDATNNITCSPQITSDTNNYLAASGDQTDRAAEIMTMLQTTGVCNLGPGDFYVSGIVMPDRTTLKGCGDTTRVILLNSVTSGAAIEMWRKCQVSDLHIEGNTSGITLSSTVGTRHGILWAGNYQATESNADQPNMGLVSNVRIHGFTGGGITCYNTGYGTYTHMSAVNVQIWNCNAGINISYWSEFHKFTNIRTYLCYYGCINNGGNNIFTNCDFSQCAVGCLMDNSNGQSPNNTHGSMIGCVFNHSNNNSGIGIHIIGCSNGFVFEGCQIFYSQILLENCFGVQVSNCNFGSSNCNILVTGGGLTLFSGNIFQNASVSVIVNNNSYVHFVNNYERQTGGPISA